MGKTIIWQLLNINFGVLEKSNNATNAVNCVGAGSDVSYLIWSEWVSVNQNYFTDKTNEDEVIW